MIQQFIVFDPVTLKKYYFNFNELKVWLDIKTLQRTVRVSKEYSHIFNLLNPQQKEGIFKLMDKHEEKFNFSFKKWLGIPGLNVNTYLTLKYDPSAEIFSDNIKNLLEERFFFEKKIHTKVQDGSLLVGDSTFPIKAIWGMSDDFCYSEDIGVSELLPVHDRYIGIGTDGRQRILLNQNGESAPAIIEIPIYKEEDWIYCLRVEISSSVEWQNVLWADIPRIRKVYDFFHQQGFSVSGNGIENTIWTRDGDIIEFNQTRDCFYKSFILIRQANYRKDTYSKLQLGRHLYDALKGSGLEEELYFYKGQNLLSKALNSLSITDKSVSDRYLIEAQANFHSCENLLFDKAIAEIVFCEWIRTRIGQHFKDSDYKNKASYRLCSKLKELNAWEEMLWFLTILKKEKDFNPTIIKELLPISLLQQHYFIDSNTFYQIISFWEYYSQKEKKPSQLNTARWHFDRAIEADSVGLQTLAMKRMKLFFNEVERKPKENSWVEEGLEEILPLVIKLNLENRYSKFVKIMASYFSKQRKEQGFGQLEAIDRKQYRWNSLVWCLAETRWCFHSLYLLQRKTPRQDVEINNWFNRGYEAFSEGMLYYDPSENYSTEQIIIIAHGLKTAYDMSFNLRQYELMNYIVDMMKDLWVRNYNLEIYRIIHSSFSKEEREYMADVIIEDWKKDKSEFQLTKEYVIELSSLYISVELHIDATKTILYGLENLDWSFDELVKLYQIIDKLRILDHNSYDFCQNAISKHVDVFAKKALTQKYYLADTITRVNQLL